MRSVYGVITLCGFLSAVSCTKPVTSIAVIQGQPQIFVPAEGGIAKWQSFDQPFTLQWVGPQPCSSVNAGADGLSYSCHVSRTDTNNNLYFYVILGKRSDKPTLGGPIPKPSQPDPSPMRVGACQNCTTIGTPPGGGVPGGDNSGGGTPAGGDPGNGGSGGSGILGGVAVTSMRLQPPTTNNGVYDVAIFCDENHRATAYKTTKSVSKPYTLSWGVAGTNPQATVAFQGTSPCGDGSSLGPSINPVCNIPANTASPADYTYTITNLSSCGASTGLFTIHVN